MQTPPELYRRLHIYRGLQDHHVCVTGVAKFLCDRLRGTVDERTVVLACLFHDLGNIIKADLTRLPDLLQPEGVAYWQKVKTEFHDRYGDDEHAATEAMVREIGLPERAREVIADLRFSKTHWIVQEGSLEHKVCKYSDLRVGPYGILPLEERLAEARRRYAGKTFDTGDAMTPQLLARAEQACRELEALVCTAASCDPADITDASIAPIIEELRTYPV